MGQPEKLHVSEKCLETLFHELAGMKEEEITESMNISGKTVNNHNAKLMQRLCPEGKPNKTLIYYHAMTTPGLVDILLKKFGARFPAEAKKIRRKWNHHVFTEVVNGIEEVYLRVWEDEEPLR
jgi:hypothetical protein